MGICIVMPLAAYSTFQQLVIPGGSLAPLLLLIILALVAHVPIVFGGTRALEAKALMMFRSKERRYQRLRQRSEARLDQALQELRHLFPTYLHRLTSHNATFDPIIPFGPFDADTWKTLQGLFPAAPDTLDLHSQVRWFRGISTEQAEGGSNGRPVEPTNAEMEENSAPVNGASAD